MADKEFDPWHFTTGLSEGYTGTVKDAYFGFSPEYNDGKTCILTLEIHTDDPELGEGGDVVELFPCGDGWEPANKGGNLVREDGKAKALNANSGIALLAKSGAEAGAGDVLRSRGTPFDAIIWVGITAEWKRKEFQFKDRSTGNTQTYARMLMHKFIGVEGGAQATAAQPAQREAAPAAAPQATGEPVKASPDAPAAAAAASNGAPANGLDTKTMVKLKIMAKEVKAAGGDHNAFVEKAFIEVEGVMDNPEAEQAVMNGAADSLFATA